MRLAAGLRPDPLGELERSPRPLSRKWGCLLLKGEGTEGEKGRTERGREKGRRGREGEGRIASHTILGPDMQHTSKQFHICIIKFSQHFEIAIITPSDGFIQISINYDNQVSSHKIATRDTSWIDLCWILTWFAVSAGELWWTIARVVITSKIFPALSSVFTLVVVFRVTPQVCSTSPWPQSITNALCSHHCSDKYQMPISEYKYSDLHCRNADAL